MFDATFIHSLVWWYHCYWTWHPFRIRFLLYVIWRFPKKNSGHTDLFVISHEVIRGKGRLVYILSHPLSTTGFNSIHDNPLIILFFCTTKTLAFYCSRTKYDGRLYFQFVCQSTPWPFCYLRRTVKCQDGLFAARPELSVSCGFPQEDFLVLLLLFETWSLSSEVTSQTK